MFGGRVIIISPVACCDVGGNVRFLVEQRAVVDVVNVVKQHEDNAAVLQAAYALILSLLLQGSFIHGHRERLLILSL